MGLCQAWTALFQHSLWWKWGRALCPHPPCGVPVTVRALTLQIRYLVYSMFYSLIFWHENHFKLSSWDKIHMQATFQVLGCFSMCGQFGLLASVVSLERVCFVLTVITGNPEQCRASGTMQRPVLLRKLGTVVTHTPHDWAFVRQAQASLW